MKKRKEETLRDKEQSTVQPSVQSTVQSTVQPSVQPNGAHIYSVGIVAILAMGACVFFAYNKKSAANKEKANEEQPMKPPKRCNMI